jgi:hypothetical protein
MEVVQFELKDRDFRSRYDRLFEACDSAFIQQSTDWAEAIKDLGPDRPIFLLCRHGDEDIAGLPLYLYEHSLGNIVTSVPQPGPMGGIFFRAGLSMEDLEHVYGSLLGRAEQLAREYHCVALTIITNPFFHDLELYQRYLSPTFVFENFTQYVSLAEVVSNGDILLPDYTRRSNLSRNVRRAKSAGFQLKSCDTEAEMRSWYCVHQERHRELGVEPLTLEFLRNVRRVLEPRHKSHLLLVKNGDEIASGCMYVYHRSIMDVLILSMNVKYAEHAPNYLNTEESLIEARSRGIQIYNWQSSASRKSGVYRYKQQWGSNDAVYYFVTKVFCEPKVLEEIGLDTIKQEYAWHYVVPFGVFTQGFHQKYFKKE